MDVLALQGEEVGNGSELVVSRLYSRYPDSIHLDACVFKGNNTHLGGHFLGGGRW